MKKIIGILLSTIIVLSTTFSVIGQECEQECLNAEEYLEFVVVNNPIICASEIESILVGIDDLLKVETARLEVLNVNTNEILSIDGVVDDDNCILFSRKGFQNGVYKLSELFIESDMNMYKVTFSNIGIEACFGVNEEEFCTNPDAYVVENNGTEDSVAVDDEKIVKDATIVDTNETLVSEEIKQVLETVSLDVQNNGDNFGVASVNTPVVVLDPGHGGYDGGASRTYNGHTYQEKNLNLTIAKYCKEELESYLKVKVYLTRSTDEYISIEDRVSFAKAVGATVFVSIHNNTSSKSTINGAEVYYPNSNYKPSYGEEGSAISTKILNRLIALGLKNGGIHIRNSESNDKYSDGSLADYYKLIRNSKLSGFTGIIVEHAYLSNASDVSNYLSNDSKLKSLGVADARGIADYFSLEKKEGNGVYEGKYSICNGIYTISTKLNNNKVIDIADSSCGLGANVQLNQKNGSDSQKFRIKYIGNGLYTIQNFNSGMMLDVQGASKNNGANIQQYMSNGTDAQQWIIKPVGDGYYSIFSSLSGKAIDVYNFGTSDGTNIQVYSNNNTNAQKFKLSLIDGAQEIDDGIYTISTAMNPNKVIDVAVGSMNDGANIQLYQRNNSSAQNFQVTYLGDGTYSIQCVNSNKMLDVYAGSCKYKANVQQYISNGTSSQKWIIRSAGNGYYYIISSICGNYLDVNNDCTSNGTNIYTDKPDGSVSQKFKFDKKLSSSIDGTYYIASAGNKNKVLDIYAGSRNNGANVQIYSKNNSKAQQFNIKSCGEGYYYIKNVGSGKVLDIYANSCANYANINQYTWNNTSAQKWYIRENIDGTYSFIGYNSGKCLDIEYGQLTNGANVQIYSDNNSIAQKYCLVPIN